MKKYLSILLIFCAAISFSQTKNHIDGELIVWLKKEVKAEKFCADFQTNKNSAINFSPKKLLSEQLNIWLVQFNPSAIDEKEILSAVNSKNEVQAAQFNHFVSLRSTIPNDVLFSQQFDMLNAGQTGGTIDADIDADLAWDSTTGGVTVTGDTIVVAIIDDGIDTSHIDMKENIWFNHHEMPNNNIDDDGNGYIDDYRGWNAYINSDDITDGGFGGWHGTSVAGIVGAKGNNGIGVTGVNWNVKLMIIPGSSGNNEAVVVASYSYALKMRTLYNETNGAKGAFVVATNSSFGKNLGQPADFPIWCAMYDSMGKHGIISAGATANANYNVDVDGDMPTACPSDFLISVTNTTYEDKKVAGAGYGLTTIDLGAPGENAYTVDGNGFSGYKAFGGTSGATPHVAGSVALLYAAATDSQMIRCKQNPDAFALAIKDFIMKGVDTIADLQNITVTGGRLNIGTSVKMLREISLQNMDTLIDSFSRYLPVTEMNLIADEKVLVFPNPANESVNIIYKTNSPLKISIFNLLGKEVYSFSDEKNIVRQNQLNISSLPAGIYFLSVRQLTEDKKSAVVKLVVY